MYKTELHMHSHEVSRCCDMPTEKIAARYIEAGYTTVTVTDHYGPSLCIRHPDVNERVKFFLEGYNSYRRALEGKINVLFGFELCLNEAKNDYLVYGLGADFLIAYPDICAMTRADAVDAIHEAGGLIYQAHPFRNGITIMQPDMLDGIEIFNAHNSQNSRNYLAEAFAKQEGLPGIAGSDFHHVHHWPSAGILTEKAIHTSGELLAVLRSGDYRTFGELVPKEQVLASHPV